ncbi:BTAD domain-containing putative transcriptional regulator [Actinoplanes sp. NPDC048988]|uniref:BTAD domain-containing putative transcriptional regulator n=1 Tax=Actinoplanes sp. NPDC048988 TaxID=3363901 RepID=UPI00371758C6
MEFRLLGPFEVWGGGLRIAVGNRRQERCLLGILLLAGGRVVATERIADLLWSGEPPPSARGAIQTYVGRLRRALGDHGLTIETRHDGYRVDLLGHRLDVDEFVERSRRAAEGTDAVERVRLWDDALGLWRGPLLADVADDRLRERLGAALRRQWLAGTRKQAEDLLAIGEHERALSTLEPVAAQEPADEALVALLMTALYRQGRTAEAIHRYDLTVKGLDVTPGADLRELRRRIARRDPRLDRPPAPAYAVRVRGEWLPWNVGGHPALEFCNTYAGWSGPPSAGGEWLGGYPALAAWSEQVGLVGPGTVSALLRLARRSPRAADGVLREAKRLRSLLYAVLTDPGDDRAFAAVAGFAQAAARASVLTRDGSGLARWALSPSAGLETPVHAAANAAAELLADPRRFTVCSCPGANCGWLFLDDTGRRRFCSIATCAH